MKRAISRLCAAIDRLNAAGAAVAAVACAVLAALLIVEVVATSGFAWSQPWAVEYSAYLCAVVLLAGSGYALRHSSHIRVNLVPAYLPPRANRVLDFASTIAALFITGLLAYGLVELAIRSHQRNSVSYFVMQTPLAIPQGALAASAVLLALALLARALRFLIGEPVDIEEERAAGEGAAE